jgi:hypothetical protein
MIGEGFGDGRRSGKGGKSEDWCDEKVLEMSLNIDDC